MTGEAIAIAAWTAPIFRKVEITERTLSERAEKEKRKAALEKARKYKEQKKDKKKEK